MKKFVVWIFFFILPFICTACVSKKITEDEYKRIDSWLMNYYRNYYNADNWYVRGTNLKYDEYVVVELVAAEDDYVETLKNNQSAAINFARTVCPGDNEEIYTMLEKGKIDVDVFDKYGNFVTASSCN